MYYRHQEGCILVSFSSGQQSEPRIVSIKKMDSSLLIHVKLYVGDRECTQTLGVPDRRVVGRAGAAGELGQAGQLRRQRGDVRLQLACRERADALLVKAAQVQPLYCAIRPQHMGQLICDQMQLVTRRNVKKAVPEIRAPCHCKLPVFSLRV